MDDDTRNPIECVDCEAVPRLYETPYEDTAYVVACECGARQIDVSSVVNGSPLVHPIAGKWSNIDHDHETH